MSRAHRERLLLELGPGIDESAVEALRWRSPHHPVDVRTTGAIRTAAASTPVLGHDYSQQDNPQVTYTDLVIDATTDTKCTSAGILSPPRTWQRHQHHERHRLYGAARASRFGAAGVATCDKSLGRSASTGPGKRAAGGSLLTIRHRRTAPRRRQTRSHQERDLHAHRRDQPWSRRGVPFKATRPRTATRHEAPDHFIDQ